MEWFERMKARRLQLRLNQGDVARHAGVSTGIISQYERGGYSVKDDVMDKICEILQITREELKTGKKPSDKTAAAGTKFPLLTWAQVSRWNSLTKDEIQNAPGYYCMVDCSPKTFILPVQGISMEPKYREGDMVFIDPESTPKHNSCVLVKLSSDGAPKLKQLIIEGDNKYLKSINPDWPEKIMPADEKCVIIGEVVASGKPE